MFWTEILHIWNLASKTTAAVGDGLFINSSSTARERQHNYINRESQCDGSDYNIYAKLRFLISFWVFGSMSLRIKTGRSWPRSLPCIRSIGIGRPAAQSLIRTRTRNQSSSDSVYYGGRTINSMKTCVVNRNPDAALTAVTR